MKWSHFYFLAHLDLIVVAAEIDYIAAVDLVVLIDLALQTDFEVVVDVEVHCCPQQLHWVSRHLLLVVADLSLRLPSDVLLPFQCAVFLLFALFFLEDWL